MRVWRDYTQKDNQQLATAWQTVQGHRPGARSISAVVDWQQMTGCLVFCIITTILASNSWLYENFDTPMSPYCMSKLLLGNASLFHKLEMDAPFFKPCCLLSV